MRRMGQRLALATVVYSAAIFTGVPESHAKIAGVVRVDNSRFTPKEVAVNPSDDVFWAVPTPRNGEPPEPTHSLTSEDGKFPERILNPGDAVGWPFNTPGDYLYYCKFHGGPGGVGMSGLVRVVSAEPLSPGSSERRSGGVAVRLCSLRLGHQPALAGLKHLNRLENVLARAEWSDPEIAEGLLCDTEGNVICGTMTNIFVAAGGALATPRLDRCGVAGVTRERVMEAAAQAGYSCGITTLTWSEVLGADEVFLVNSLAGIWPVRDLDGRSRTPGTITRELQRALERDDDAQMA